MAKFRMVSQAIYGWFYLYFKIQRLWLTLLKLIKYSLGQQQINEAYLGHKHEPWYPMNTQMKILWVLIWDQTWFWSQIKHLHFSIINASLTTIPKMTWIFNNCSSSPNWLWVNSLWGQRQNGLLTQRPWGWEEGLF